MNKWNRNDWRNYYYYLCAYLSILVRTQVSRCIVNDEYIYVYHCYCRLISHTQLKREQLLYFRRDVLVLSTEISYMYRTHARTHASTLHTIRKKKKTIIWNFITDSISFGVVVFCFVDANNKISIINQIWVEASGNRCAVSSSTNKSRHFNHCILIVENNGINNKYERTDVGIASSAWSERRWREGGGDDDFGQVAIIIKNLSDAIGLWLQG